MFLRFNTRRKDGKVHRYWSIVENRRLRAGHTLQRTVLYLGEINDTQQAAWRKSLEALDEATQLTEQVCLFPQDREIPPDVLNGLQVNLSELELRRPRAFGDCRLDAHRGALLTHLQARWKDLFGATYNLLLYDLTSSYFEGEMEQAPKAKHGYSRDRRPDCRQVIIAVVLSVEVFRWLTKSCPAT